MAGACQWRAFLFSIFWQRSSLAKEQLSKGYKMSNSRYYQIKGDSILYKIKGSLSGTMGSITDAIFK